MSDLWKAEIANLRQLVAECERAAAEPKADAVRTPRAPRAKRPNPTAVRAKARCRAVILAALRRQAGPVSAYRLAEITRLRHSTCVRHLRDMTEGGVAREAAGRGGRGMLYEIGADSESA